MWQDVPGWDEMESVGMGWDEAETEASRPWKEQSTARRMNNGQLLGMALISSLSSFLQPPAFIFTHCCLFVCVVPVVPLPRFSCPCHFQCECAVVVVGAEAWSRSCCRCCFRVRKMCNGISSGGA